MLTLHLLHLLSFLHGLHICLSLLNGLLLQLKSKEEFLLLSLLPYELSCLIPTIILLYYQNSILPLSLLSYLSTLLKSLLLLLLLNLLPPIHLIQITSINCRSTSLNLLNYSYCCIKISIQYRLLLQYLLLRHICISQLQK